MFHRWHIFDRIHLVTGESLGDFLFSYYHPILSMCSGPIVMVILFIAVLWPISAVGRHGIIPAAALLICIVLMHLLYSKVSNTILYVWMQPFICYAEFIFIKYALAANNDDPGVGLIGWLVFAALALIIMWYTASFLDIIDNSWGWIYIIPYGAAWIFSLVRQWYVYYIVVYLALFALIMSVYITLKRRKKRNFDIDEAKAWPAVLVSVLTIFACLQPMIADMLTPDIMQAIKTIPSDPNVRGVVKFFAATINFFVTFPVTHGIGVCINRLASLLAQYG